MQVTRQGWLFPPAYNVRFWYHQCTVL